MFGKAKIQDFTVWKSQDTEFQSLEKQNTEFQCLEQPKFRIFCNFTIAMTTTCTSQCQDGNKVLKCSEKALENLNTRKSTSRRILTGILSRNFENSELKPNLRSKHLM